MGNLPDSRNGDVRGKPDAGLVARITLQHVGTARPSFGDFRIALGVAWEARPCHPHVDILDIARLLARAKVAAAGSRGKSQTGGHIGNKGMRTALSCDVTVRRRSMTSHSTRKLHGDLPSASSKVASADRKELAAIAFERTRMPMVVADARAPDLPIVLANKSFLELTGYAAEEVLGRNCRFLQGPATSPTAVAEIRAGIADEREVDVEILNYKKSGEQFWNRLHLSPVHGDDGQILYVFGSQIDITDYRRIEALEASEHRLLREVDHRAKNVLAIVDSIVRLSNAEDPALYAASIQHRVQALARAHGLLAERRWTSISVEEIVRQQVAPFAAARASFSGPDIRLPAPVVQPLALVFHELAVNAARHGALAVARGTLSISWKPGPLGTGLNIRWQEVGTGIPPKSAKRGFGTVIVGAMVEKQLKGRIERNWGNEGLLINIEIPADRSPSYDAPLDHAK